MILQALTQYYERLAEKGKLKRPGWQMMKVSFALCLGRDGALLDIFDLRNEKTQGKKTVKVPRKFDMPEQVKRSSGVAANFLCENASYFLGYDQKGKPERSRQCFEACAALHHELLDGIDHPMARAILGFFDSWKPEDAAQNEFVLQRVKELETANLMFMLGDENAQDVPEIAAAWQARYDRSDADAVWMRCLVTGERAPIARLHPSIKGIQGAQSSGAALVSFNAPAFDSYGRDEAQGLNAPVSRYAAFAYGAALNYLIAQKEHTAHFGDTTVLFWAEDADERPVGLMSAFFGEPSVVLDNDLYAVMQKLQNGDNVPWEEWPINPDNRFFVLGLAPNAARLSVRFFLQDRFGTLAEHVAAHHRRMEIVRPSFDSQEYLPIWKLLSETVNPNARDKAASPHMAGDVLTAILSGGRYPTTLYEQVQFRVRAEQNISRGKAAIVKAYLLRNHADQNERIREVLQVKLNEETTYAPYVLGRLFAVLEGLQDAANPGINTTIRDRYFTSACCTPALVFPKLINLAQAHLKKLEEGGTIYFSKQITELIAKLDETYPKQLDINDQGVFQLGYYHQTQKRFEKKEEKNNG